ncbi:MAG: type II toxin-antitoxin system RelE family toxin [Alphaproteobacteria bacterium]|jgi:mRNA interferase RelE/StbE
MPFSVTFLGRVREEDYPFITKSAQVLIDRAITQRLTTDPSRYGKALHGKLAGLRRLRVSTYRIIYKVYPEKQLVIIHAIGHRKGIYDQ